jgi:hypothetical protein
MPNSVHRGACSAKVGLPLDLLGKDGHFAGYSHVFAKGRPFVVGLGSKVCSWVFCGDMTENEGPIWTHTPPGSFIWLIQFSPFQTYDTGHHGKLSSVLYNYGSIITCSTDKTVRIMEPCLNPANIHTLKAHDAEVAGVSIFYILLLLHSSEFNLASLLCFAHLWLHIAVYAPNNLILETTIC